MRHLMGPVAVNDNSARAKPCPICGKPSEAHWQPFCSKRCADVDLNRWLSGRYAIPARDDDPDNGVADADPSEEPRRPPED
jgi:endogenous inhibitor of DNA gyrase (YacG/DUF329 family)